LAGSSRPSRLIVENPGSVKVSVYTPGRRSTMRYPPLASVTTERVFSMRTGLAASTVTPGSTAPVTLTVFEDPQCPFCRQWNVDTLPTVVDRYVRTGKLKLEYRGIVVIGVNSVAGLRAIYGAAPQNKLWNLVEALYERQGEENSGWITLPVIRDAAREVGADPAKVIAAADSKSVTQALNENQQLAKDDHITGTPGFVLQRQLGAPVLLQVGGLEPDQFTPSLDAALQ